MNTPSAPIVSFEQITKRYAPRLEDAADAPALHNLDLTIQQGEIFGVIGESGAGKSTLLQLINGLTTPSSGSMTVAGAQVPGLGRRGLRALRRDIGVVFQGIHLLSSRTVRQNVALPLQLARKQAGSRVGRRDSRSRRDSRDQHGRRDLRAQPAQPDQQGQQDQPAQPDQHGERHRLTRSQERDAVAEIIDFVGLSHRANHYPAQLSGGEQQRVGLARALVARPALLLCDEPTSSLDASTTAGVLRVLANARERLGTTVVVITHDLQVVRAICDRAALLDQGQLRELIDVDTIGVRALPSYHEQVRQELMG